MRNKLLGLAIVGAAIAMTVAACGTEGETATTCAGDGDCQTGEICHPLAKVCVTSCTDGNGCPSESKNCDSLTVGGTVGADGGVTGGTTSGKFCQCSTTALCGGGTDPNVICAKEDKICTTKCTSDGQCGTGRKCDSATGDCITTATGGGGGGGNNCTPACAANETCTNNACAATACSSTNTQPDTCGNGAFCSGSSCVLVPPPPSTCPNASGHGTAWTPAANAPVIYEISLQDVTTNATFCGNTNPKRVRVTVKAYWKDGNFPATDAAIEGILHYIRADGTEGPTASTIQNLTGGGSKHVTFTQNFCIPASQNSLGMADHFRTANVDGNVVCGQFNTP